MAIAIKDSIEAAFGRHETFTIRYGWLKRGFDHSVVDPRLFYLDDAHHRLGVGKNMAKSIRFWLSATRLMAEVPDPENSRRTMMRPTRFGMALLSGLPTVGEQSYSDSLHAFMPAFADVEGLDPYLEQLDSWWLIHWMMLSPKGKLPVWWTAFNTFSPVVFTVESLTDHVMAQIEATAAWNNPTAPAATTVKKDVLALLRAYAGAAGIRKADKSEDDVDAPMVPLTLISDVGGRYRFAVGRKPGLTAAVVAFASLDFLSTTSATAKTALVSTLASEVGGPGRAFKLSEREFGELLEAAASAYPDLIQMRTAGSSPVLAIRSEMPMREIASEILFRHYESGRAAGAATRRFDISSQVITECEGISDGSSDTGAGSVRSVSQT
ncbi:DUF4007 family protein [Antrihabitans sp. YC2-6]|uniref:DUF4007 family protein n=1 Tax=Antrihabitans sp. YC2-6 TaxID=2799498 RepID=UPI0018F4AA91|nr:DUF4007 family protein [Antrihabitans sp. YC2-6]MBJ8348846.1 DUF4007 family protein [Antrihabitans sp. YC2-6]